MGSGVLNLVMYLAVSSSLFPDMGISFFAKQPMSYLFLVL